MLYPSSLNVEALEAWVEKKDALPALPCRAERPTCARLDFMALHDARAREARCLLCDRFIDESHLASSRHLKRLADPGYRIRMCCFLFYSVPTQQHRAGATTPCRRMAVRPVRGAWP